MHALCNINIKHLYLLQWLSKTIAVLKYKLLLSLTVHTYVHIAMLYSKQQR